MASKYLTQLKLLFRENKTVSEALQSVLSQYVEDKFVESDKDEDKLIYTPAFKKEIQQFIEHIKTAAVGHIALGYNFSSALADDFKELLNIARLREQAVLNSTSVLVTECENIAAAQGHSLRAIFRETARLEKALKEKQVEARHLNEVKIKLNEWLALLYEKFADLILTSQDLDALNKAVEESFSAALCQDLPLLSEVKQEIECQIEFLEDKDFFDEFYSNSSLADKYEFTFDFYQSLKAAGKMTTELRATLSHLFYATINKAYAPCDAKKFNLMRKQGATVEVVFEALQQWTQVRWLEFKTSVDLYAELTQRLEQDKEHYEGWQQVGEVLRPGVRHEMFELHCMKYAGNPNQDPRALLVLVASPVKAKPKRKKDEVTTTDPKASALPATTPVNLTSLFCEEESFEEIPEVKRTKKDK